MAQSPRHVLQNVRPSSSGPASAHRARPSRATAPPSRGRAEASSTCAAMDLVARYPDGSASEAFAYDVVERRAIDAVSDRRVSLAGRREPLSSPTSTSEPPRACRSCFARVRRRRREHVGAPRRVDRPGGDRRARLPRARARGGARLRRDRKRARGARRVGLAGAWVHRGARISTSAWTSGARAAARRPRTARRSSAARHRSGPALRDSSRECRAGRLRDAKTELALRRFAERA